MLQVRRTNTIFGSNAKQCATAPALAAPLVRPAVMRDLELDSNDEDLAEPQKFLGRARRNQKTELAKSSHRKSPVHQAWDLI